MRARGCGALLRRVACDIGRDERGASLVEYLVVVGCISLLAVAGWRRFGVSVTDKVSSQADCIATFSCSEQGSALATGDTTDAVTTTTTPSGYQAELDAALQTLADDFGAIAGDDGVITEADLQAALHSSDADVRDAAQFLLDNPSALHALDVGQDDGDVDGDISREDVAGLQEALQEGSLNEILADTAHGEGGRDGDISRDDLQALIDDPGVPQDVHDWAVDQLASMPEDDGCSGPFCAVRGAAGWVADTAGDTAGWVGDAASNTAGWVGDRASDAYHIAHDVASWQLRYGPLGFHVGVLRGAWGTVTTLGWAVTHPVDAFQGVNYALAHPVESLWVLGDGIRSEIAGNPAQGVGQLGFDIGSLFIPGGGASKAAKAADVADHASTVATVGQLGDEASEAHVPGWVSAIDDASIFVNPVTVGPARVVEWIFG
jgi:pilus assembly protein Flp/PilA